MNMNYVKYENIIGSFQMVSDLLNRIKPYCRNITVIHSQAIDSENLGLLIQLDFKSDLDMKNYHEQKRVRFQN